MDLFSIVLLAIALAMDCFAVSIASGVVLKHFRLLPVLKMAFLFGFFQGVMPLIGFFVGVYFKNQIESYDHWIALIILCAIGLKMIIEDFEKKDDKSEKNLNPFAWKSLLLLSIATSVDALATGIIFITQPHLLLTSVLIIALVSFLLSFFGLFLGGYFGKKFTAKFGVLGGIILIVIGIKILLEHIYF